ncbi:hypothetical protein AEQU1_00004 [Aequorivita sp. CIP111184]|nr:hypothetical protein AEQU1_00004 [Aequorivita sp. CIP111184]
MSNVVPEHKSKSTIDPVPEVSVNLYQTPGEVIEAGPQVGLPESTDANTVVPLTTPSPVNVIALAQRSFGGMASASKVIAKLFIIPKLLAQPLLATELPHLCTTLKAGSPAGCEPINGFSFNTQKTSLLLAFRETEMVLSSSL